MNNQKILQLIGDQVLDSNLVNDGEYDDIQWKTQDSKDSDVLFFKGNSSKFVKNLLEANAGVVITDNPETYKALASNKILVSEDDWALTQKNLLDVFYPYPQSIKIMGVTGTNGKSTVVNFIEQIFQQQNEKIVTCGTLGLFINGKKEEDFFLTTPSFIDTRKILHKYKDYKYFAFEVSSHALSQERFYKIPFDSVAWTSFSQDHLDYHKTMEEYFHEKLKIINYSQKPLIVPEKEKELQDRLSGVNFVKSKKITNYPDNKVFAVDFNKSNFEIALSLSEKTLEKELVVNLQDIKTVPGRFQLYQWGESYFVVDYAHTPGALINICTELKKTYPDHTLISVFGCGGDRDRNKRPKMAAAVEKLSDKVILTSDNPRYEDPNQIVDDAKKGFKNPNQHIVIVDREEAIRKSFDLINSPSVVLVAGKGHEPYLDVKGVKHDYSDASTIERIIKTRND